MSITEQDIELAATLIYFGIERKTKPYSDTLYTQLVKKYRSNSDFKTVVDRVAAGLKLKVLAVEDFGIVLTPVTESIFAFSLSDIKDNEIKIRTDEKLLWGIALLGIVVYLYPKKESFDRDRVNEVRTVHADKIDEFIRKKCNKISTDVEYSDTLSENPELERMFREYISRRQVDGETPRSLSTTLYIIKTIFKFLIREHLALPVKNDDNACKILPQFRLLAGELSTNEYFKLFIEKKKEGDDPAKSE